MENKVEKLAEDYAEIHMEKFDLVDSSKLPYFHNDRYKLEDAFEADYLQKTAKIRDLIEKLELTKMKHSQSSGVNVEVVNNYNAEQDRKINLLKILL